MLASAFSGSSSTALQLCRVIAARPVQQLICNALLSTSSHKFEPLPALNHEHHDPWYFVKPEARLDPPITTGEELNAFESHHPSQRFTNILSSLRSVYPSDVWQSITRIIPNPDRKSQPACVDIAIGAEGRGGVELARRGFHVVGVEADPQLLARTFQFAQAHNAPIELMTAKVEHSLLQDSTTDLVTFFHGLHLVDTTAALREAWRLLRPHGRLVAAWNDRDLTSPFVRELEDVLERHVPSYNRFQKQRSIDAWGERLQEGGLFRLVEYAVYPNPIPMASVSALLDVLDCQSFVRASLHGEERKRLNADVRGVLERRFERKAFVLPLETKMYVMEKINEGEKLATKGKKNGNSKYHHAHHVHHHHLKHHHH